MPRKTLIQLVNVIEFRYHGRLFLYLIAQTEFWCFELLFLGTLQRVSCSLSFHRPKQYSNALLMSLKCYCDQKKQLFFSLDFKTMLTKH